jgi:hypothetical protein
MGVEVSHHQYHLFRLKILFGNDGCYFPAQSRRVRSVGVDICSTMPFLPPYSPKPPQGTPAVTFRRLPTTQGHVLCLHLTGYYGRNQRRLPGFRFSTRSIPSRS